VTGRIVCVGEVMLDVLAAEPPPGVRHGPVLVRAGGTPVNAALAAAREGAEAVVVGRVGRDPAAAAIRAALADAGVEAVLAVDEDRQTGAYVEAGPTVVASRGASANLAPGDVPEVAARAVLVSGYVLAHDDTRAAAERALALDARWRGVTAVPLGPFEVPAAANILFATEDEAPAFDTDAFEVVVVTRGAEGAYVLRGGRTEYLPPTGVGGTGAGDALAGAFLASLLD
jgi:sugar/nucleoside kinase (ribokinase family)